MKRAAIKYEYFGFGGYPTPPHAIDADRCVKSQMPKIGSQDPFAVDNSEYLPSERHLDLCERGAHVNICVHSYIHLVRSPTGVYM